MAKTSFGGPSSSYAVERLEPKIPINPETGEEYTYGEKAFNILAPAIPGIKNILEQSFQSGLIFLDEAFKFVAPKGGFVADMAEYITYGKDGPGPDDPEFDPGTLVDALLYIDGSYDRKADPKTGEMPTIYKPKFKFSDKDKDLLLRIQKGEVDVLGKFIQDEQKIQEQRLEGTTIGDGYTGEGFFNSDLEDKSLAALQSMVGVATTVIPAALTGGRSLAPQIIAPMISNYNLEKAKYLFGEDDPDALKKLGDADGYEIATPALLGYVSYKLEKLGFDKISKYVSLPNFKPGQFIKLIKTGQINGIQEGLQGIVEKFNSEKAKGNSYAEAAKNIYNDPNFAEDLKEDYMMGVVGGTAISGGGRALRRSLRADEGSKNIVNKYINELEDLQEKMNSKSSEVSEAAAKQYKKTTEDFQNYLEHNNKIADFLNEDQKSEMVNILKSKDAADQKVEKLRQQKNQGIINKEEFDLAYKDVIVEQAESDARLNEIKKDANKILIEKDLSTVRKAIKKITGLNIYSVSDSSSFLKELNKRRKAQGKREYTLEEVKDVDGTIIGKDILINMDVAADMGAITVGSHELLHAVLRSVINGKDGKITDEGRKLVKSFREELSDKELSIIEERLEEKYELKRDEDGNIDESNFDEYAEEYFNAYIDGAIDNEFNDNQVMKLAKYFQNIFKKEAKFNGEFKNGADMKAFLKQYVSDVRRGEVGDVFVNLAQKGVDINTEAKSSRSKAVDSVNETEAALKAKLKKENKEYTKAEFQKSSAFNSIFSSINLDGGAINNYIKSLGMSFEKTKKVIEEARDRLLNYDPQAKRKTDSKEEIKVGEAIMSNIGYAKLDANKKLFEEGQKKKRTKSIDELDEDIEDTKTTTQETDTKDVKLRKLKDFNVELDNGLADALTIAEVNDILDNFNNGKITFEQAQKQMDKIVLNDIRASLSKIIPKISKGKPTTEYDAFIRDEYDEIIPSLGIKTIRTSYKKFFTQEKTGKKDYKNVDPVTGKVSNFVKDTQINTTNKREFIRYFLEAKGGVLTERRTALIRRIAKRKASLAVDNYVSQNSNNLDAVIAAKIRTMSDSAENATNEQVSFDSVKFMKTFKKKFNKIKGQMGKLKKPIDGFTHYYKPPGWKKGDKVLTFSYKEKTGKFNEGFAYEQAFAETLEEVGMNIKDFEVTLKVSGEEGGVADAQVSYLGEIENHEIKKSLSAFFGSTLINGLDILNKSFTLANEIHNSIKSRDGKTTLPQFIKNKLIPSLKEKVKEINAEIDAYNKKYNYKKGDAEFAEQITGNVKKGKSEKIPREVWNKVGKELGVLKAGLEIIQNHYGAKGAGAVKSISIFGFGSFRLDPTSIFKGLEMLDVNTEVYASLRYGKSSQQGSQEFVTFKPGLQFRLDGKPKNTPNSGIITEQSILEALGNPGALSKDVTKVKTLDNAIVASRSIKKTRGITVLDFDDTLATSKSLIRYTTPNGEKGTLTPEQYASTYQDLLGLGYKFDFSEFNKVVDGKVAPLFQKALKLQGKFGPENMFVLTARPAESAPAIFAFLKANGLNIPLKNITGLANSTSEAKALWIADKVGEGYNDFYFADDALQNVQAVDNMLNQFDVKRKVQQAKVKFSKSIKKKFNDILEDVTGIESYKRFERTKARKRGASKGKFRFFIPPSHEDFVGLLYNFMGKGKQGDAHRDFFEKALVRPLNRAYREIDAAKQAVANDYKALNKQMPEVNKMLSKKTPDGDFTYQDAIRVYLWDKHGYKIPGLSEVDQAKLVELVKSDGMLQSYAETLNAISKQETYVDPGPNWENGNIRIDLVDATGRVGRVKYFEEFQENADIIFSEENLNKIEAGYGSNFREALEDMLHRIKTGVNRPKGSSAKPNIFMNWLNASVAGVMFFNVRSSLLQQMSNVNYLNFADNNILAAGKAFANQLQYWKDFAMIFNSDMLKQRRGGLQTDINGAELAEAIKKARPGNMFDQVAIIVGKALRLGFLPTQIGDNIAIATGGAAFYRNRVNKYLKDGLSKKEAETKAFTDFQNITQSTQQSARPDMTSQQQASWIGKLILNFLNTPSQYNRIIKKAASDIKNKRITPPNTSLMQSNMSNMSRILYYGAAQNLIFYSLQTALFAVMFGSDDEDEDKKAEQFLKKKERVINGSIDTILRGSGIYGVALSTLKNMAIKFLEQREKGYNKDESAVVMELFNFSPVVGIKARRIVNAEKTLNYNKKVIEEMETFDIDNPMWSAVTNYTQTITTAPVNKIYQKTINLRNAADRDYTTLQRLLFFSGYTTWSLNLGDTKKMKKIKEDIKNKDNNPAYKPKPKPIKRLKRLKRR